MCVYPYLLINMTLLAHPMNPKELTSPLVDKKMINTTKIHIPLKKPGSTNLWKLQDHKMDVLYHMRPYVVGIFLEIKAFYMVGTSNKSDPEMAIELTD